MAWELAPGVERRGVLCPYGVITKLHARVFPELGSEHTLYGAMSAHDRYRPASHL